MPRDSFVRVSPTRVPSLGRVDSQSELRKRSQERGMHRSAPNSGRLSAGTARSRHSTTSRYSDPMHTSRYLNRMKADGEELRSRPGFGSFYKASEGRNGPGSYDVRETPGKDAPSSTISARFTQTASFILKAEQHALETPDPGAYDADPSRLDKKRSATLGKSGRCLTPKSYARRRRLRDSGTSFMASKSTLTSSSSRLSGVGVVADSKKAKAAPAFSFSSSRRF